MEKECKFYGIGNQLTQKGKCFNYNSLCNWEDYVLDKVDTKTIDNVKKCQFNAFLCPESQYVSDQNILILIAAIVIG